MRFLLLFVSICASITLQAQDFKGVKFPIRRVYHFNDGYLVLAESIDSIAADKDTLHYNIQGVCYNSNLEKKWEMNDHIFSSLDESSIWFWTKFCEVKDIDGDGIVDPVIVYGSNGLNGSSDGRIKILIYYKGVKSAIRHQDSEMDEGRYTDIDASFYTLPAAIQQHAKKLMAYMDEHNLAIYAHDYKVQMGKKATHIQ